MNKKIIFIIMIFLMLMNSIFALKIGISPSKLEFNRDVNEKVCKKVILYSNQNVDLIGEVRWGNKISSNFNDYNLTGNLNLKIDYKKKINVKSKESVNVCVTVLKSGVYYGVLVYRSEEGYGGVGSLMVINISGGDFEDERGNEIGDEKLGGISFITGGIVGEKKDNGNIRIFLSLSFVVLILVLIWMLFRYNKMKRGVV